MSLPSGASPWNSIFGPGGKYYICKIEWYFSFFMIPLTGIKFSAHSFSKHFHIITDPVPRLSFGTRHSFFSLSHGFLLTYHHHHVVPPARISLTISHHFSLSFIASGRSSGLHPVSSHSCCKFGLVVLLLLGHMWGPLEYITYELLLASPAISGVSGSSNMYIFRDGRQVAV